MSKPSIDAHISEISGAYYPVKLHVLPRPGDLIDLYSFIDTADGHPPRHFYEVVQVVHTLYDVTDKIEPPKEGHHFVTVHVKKSQSEFLGR